jgi:hypothetical protein
MNFTPWGLILLPSAPTTIFVAVSGTCEMQTRMFMSEFLLKGVVCVGRAAKIRKGAVPLIVEVSIRVRSFP